MAKDPIPDAGARSLVPQSTFDGWFNPSKPITAMAPPGTEVRQYDFPLTQNTIWTPRGYEPISFHHIRMMADGCYLIRAIIDKMKDRVCNREWHFRLKANPGEIAAANAQRSAKDPRIGPLTDFFQSPDSIHDFNDWARLLLEDRLVIDAATLEVQRNRGGQIINLLPVDGSTINVLIDSTGRRPRAPLPAYRQIVHGLPATDLTTSDLIYMPANVRNQKLYGYSPVEQTLSLIVTLIYKTLFHQNFYSESDIPAASMPMPKDMSTSEIIRFMRELQAYMADNPDNRSRIYPVPEGSKIDLIKKEEYQNKFEEWAARVFAYVLGETATPFTQQNNRATAQQSDDTREEAGEKPLLGWFGRRMNAIVQRADLINAPDIEFVWNDDEETDRLKQAQIDQINVTIHTRTPNELRERDGLPDLEGEDEFPSVPPPGGNDDEDDEEDTPPKPAKASKGQKKKTRY